ncbi:MAG: hypothetical protein ACYTKD_15545 [Planctomycetota bacterium]|jgi:hypothetical protein
MTTERERIEKLLADGKVSPMEAERLRAALEKAERDEAARPAAAGEGQADRLGRPRLSRLALAGVLGLPAAGVTFLFVMGLAIVFGVIEERAAGGGLMMAAAVALVGVGLSIAGLVVTRRQPDRFSGRRLATAGIIAPIAQVRHFAGNRAVFRPPVDAIRGRIADRWPSVFRRRL